MVFGKTKLELKVGIFVLCGLAILFFFILSIGSFKTWRGGYRVKFTFGFVNGIKRGAPVRFSGVDVGEVKRIRFIPSCDGEKLRIEVTSWIRSNIKIPADSTAWVNTLGLLGEKYVEVMPGINFNNPLKPNDVLKGEDPMPMQEITQMAKRIGTNLDEITGKVKKGEGTVGKFFNDDAVYNNLASFTDDIKKNPWKLIWKSAEKK